MIMMMTRLAVLFSVLAIIATASVTQLTSQDQRALHFSKEVNSSLPLLVIRSSRSCRSDPCTVDQKDPFNIIEEEIEGLLEELLEYKLQFVFLLNEEPRNNPVESKYLLYPNGFESLPVATDGCNLTALLELISNYTDIDVSKLLAPLDQDIPETNASHRQDLELINRYVVMVRKPFFNTPISPKLQLIMRKLQAHYAHRSDISFIMTRHPYYKCPWAGTSRIVVKRPRSNSVGYNGPMDFDNITRFIDTVFAKCYEGESNTNVISIDSTLNIDEVMTKNKAVLLYCTSSSSFLPKFDLLSTLFPPELISFIYQPSLTRESKLVYYPNNGFGSPIILQEKEWEMDETEIASTLNNYIPSLPTIQLDTHWKKIEIYEFERLTSVKLSIYLALGYSRVLSVAQRALLRHVAEFFQHANVDLYFVDLSGGYDIANSLTLQLNSDEYGCGATLKARFAGNTLSEHSLALFDKQKIIDFIANAIELTKVQNVAEIKDEL